MVLAGVGVFEVDQPADYPALASAGVRWISIQASNNAGSGLARAYEALFPVKLAASESVGLDVLAATSWQGPPEASAIDSAGYLGMCATYCANLGFSPSGWVVIMRDRQAPGLSEALRTLRSQTGKPVYLSFPGDPLTQELRWDWSAIVQVVDGLMPQFLTSPANWNGSPDARGSTDAGQGVKDAISEMNRAGLTGPTMIPLGDETDPARIAGWMQAITAWNPQAVGYWRWRAGDQSVVAKYAQALAAAAAARVPVENSAARYAGTEVRRMGGGQGGRTPLGQGTAASAPPTVTGWRQLVTPGPDQVEPGVFTSEFLATQLTALLTALFALFAAFGWFGLTADQKKAIIDLAVALIAALEAVYTVSRSVRKGMASPSRQPADAAAAAPTGT